MTTLPTLKKADANFSAKLAAARAASRALVICQSEQDWSALADAADAADAAALAALDELQRLLAE